MQGEGEGQACKAEGLDFLETACSQQQCNHHAVAKWSLLSCLMRQTSTIVGGVRRQDMMMW